MSKRKPKIEELIKRREELGEEWVQSYWEEGDGDRDSDLQKEITKLEVEIERHQDLPALAARQLERDAKEQEPKTAQPGRARWYESSPEVLKRRQIVLKNPEMANRVLCKVFDSERISLPEKWEGARNVRTWEQAYRDPKLRQRVHKIISTDRSAGGC